MVSTMDEQDFVIDTGDIKTKTIERLIAPFVALVTELRGDYWEKHDPTENGALLLEKCERTLKYYLEISGKAIRQVGSLITEESRIKILTTYNAVETSGEDFIATAREFVQNTADIEQRIRTSQAGRALLMNVARMLIVADKLDLQKIIDKTDKVVSLIDGIANARDERQLVELVSTLRTEMTELTELTRRRLKDMKNPSQQDDLQVAMSQLKLTAPIMVASSKAHIQHPNLHEARENRRYAHKEILSALNGVKCALNGEDVPKDVGISRQGDLCSLAANLDKFQSGVCMDHRAYRPNKHRPQLENILEDVIRDAAVLANWREVSPNRNQQIVDGGNNLRQALQELLSEYEKNHNRLRTSSSGDMFEADDDLELSIDNTMHKIRDFRRHLRRAIADVVTDTFLTMDLPLIQLLSSAQSGDVERTQQMGHFFQEQMDRQIEVARRVCDMSSDRDANRIVRYAALCCEKITPQVVHAALLLAQQPNSAILQENMQSFRAAFEDRKALLVMAVDRMLSVVDFLAVSEQRIQEDTKSVIQGIMECNSEQVDNSAGAIRGRCLRICEVVDAEMETIQPCPYTENVRLATKILKDQVLDEFVVSASGVVKSVQEGTEDGKQPTMAERNNDVEKMIEACELVHNAVRDIRTAVLRNHNPEDVDSDNEYVEDGVTTVLDNASQISDNDCDNQAKILKNLPEESKRKIQEQIDVFNVMQRKFIHEVGKWDDTGNELISIAKQMCLMCDDMTQFTKGRGPLKRTSDVINTAKEVADAGNRLNALATEIGKDCTESATKKDLTAYIESIVMLSHQLRITSRVKADIQQVGDKLEVRGLDSVTSLIQNVKNLLNAVIHCVRAAYIASTKIRPRDGRVPRVQWVLAPPDMQPLVRSQSHHRSQGIIRRASERYPQKPLQALEEFRTAHLE